jgi:hypothetical protein
MSNYWQGAGSTNKTDLYSIFNMAQNTQITYVKQAIIGTIRDVFSLDSYYCYRSDPWGYPLTVDNTDLPPDAGINDSSTTRVFISESNRFEVIYYPAILVKSGGTSSVPISFNRNKENILFDTTIVSDGYNEKIYTTPIASITTGAWEGSITVEVQGLGMRERDDITEIISAICADWRHDDLRRAGVLIKKISVGAPSEKEDRNNKLFTQTITLEVRSEWRREIPIDNIIDIISFCVEFGHTNTKTGEFIPDPNLEWHSNLSLIDAFGL